jgi:hypothetical protein
LLPASEVQSSCACQEVTREAESIAPVILELALDRLTVQPDDPAALPPGIVPHVPTKQNAGLTQYRAGRFGGETNV